MKGKPSLKQRLKTTARKLLAAWLEFNRFV